MNSARKMPLALIMSRSFFLFELKGETKKKQKLILSLMRKKNTCSLEKNKISMAATNKGKAVLPF
jgi:hypothetical protein